VSEESLLQRRRARADALIQEAAGVYEEEPAIKRLRFGPGVHEGNDSAWMLYFSEADEPVGSVTVNWPDGPQYVVLLNGRLWDPLRDFNVISSDIASVLLHLSIEFGRQQKEG
jgi:hypothetical protein